MSPSVFDAASHMCHGLLYPIGPRVISYHKHVSLGEWEHWSACVTDYVYPDVPPEYSLILIPNVDNVRTTFFMHTIAKQVTLKNESEFLVACTRLYTSL